LLVMVVAVILLPIAMQQVVGASPIPLGEGEYDLCSSRSRIDILTFADFHGTVDGLMNENDPGAPVFVAYAMWQRAQNPNPDNVVFISGGDDFHGHPVSGFNYTRNGMPGAIPPAPIPEDLPVGQGAPTLAMMEYLGQEYMPLGNHEISFGFRRTLELAEYMNFLAADLFYEASHVNSGQRPDFVQPYAILEFEEGNIRVGVIGLMTRGMGHLVADPVMEYFNRRTPTIGYHWMDDEAVATADANPEYARAIEGLIGELREDYGVDAVVAATHMYGDEMRILASIIDGFDAIIGGHGHQRIAEEVNGTPIIEAGQHGRSLGRVSLYFIEGELEQVTVTLNPAYSIRDFAPTSIHGNSQEATGHEEWEEFARHHQTMTEILYYYHRQSDSVLNQNLGLRGVYSETRTDRNAWATGLVLGYVTRNVRVNLGESALGGNPLEDDVGGRIERDDQWIFFSNFGSWRNVPPFEFTPETSVSVREINSVMPFESAILLYEMYGRELITLLSMEASYDASVDPPTFGINGGQPVVVAGALRGERVEDIEIGGVLRPRWEWILTDGTPIRDNDTLYQVIGSSFTAEAAADRFPVPGNPWGDAMEQRVVAPPVVLMNDGSTRPWAEFAQDDPSTYASSGISTLRHAMIEEQIWREHHPSYTANLVVAANGHGTAWIDAPFAPEEGYQNVVVTPTRVILRAMPDSGEQADFVGWYLGNVRLSEELMLQITIAENTAIEARFEGYEDEASKEELRITVQQTIDEMGGLEKSEFTIESWRRLEEALRDAVDAYENQGTTQVQADVAVSILEESRGALARQVNRNALSALLEVAYDLKETDYESIAWRRFEDTLTTAFVIYNDYKAFQSQVDEAVEELLKAMEDLEYRALALIELEVADIVEQENAVRRIITAISRWNPFQPEQGKSRLRVLLSMAWQLEAELYDEEGWEAFIEALEIAIDVYEYPEANQRQINRAANSLGRSMDGLREVGAVEEGEEIDRSALGIVLVVARSRLETNYTTDSWATFAAAISEAGRVYNNAGADQGQLEAARVTLIYAMVALSRHDGAPVPETKEERIVLGAILMILFAISSMVMLVKVRRRRRKRIGKEKKPEEIMREL